MRGLHRSAAEDAEENLSPIALNRRRESRIVGERIVGI